MLSREEAGGQSGQRRAKTYPYG